MKGQTDFDFTGDDQPLNLPKTGPIPAESKLIGAPSHEEASVIPTEPKHEHDPKKNLEKIEAEAMHYNYFYLGVSGQIESGNFPFLDGLSCKFSLVCGKDWKLADVCSTYYHHYRVSIQEYRSIRLSRTMVRARGLYGTFLSKRFSAVSIHMDGRN